MKRKLPKVGDYIRVIVPLTFVRCGYPMTKEEALEKVNAEYSQNVEDLFTDIFSKSDKKLMPINKHSVIFKPSGNNVRELSKIKIKDILAYEYLRHYRFGGRERKIYVAKAPQLFRKICKVIGWKNVNTGSYYSPSNGYDSYTGEYDNEPGGLDDMRSHKIIEIEEVIGVNDCPPNAKNQKTPCDTIMVVNEWREIITDKEEKTDYWSNLNSLSSSYWIEAVNVEKIPKPF